MVSKSQETLKDINYDHEIPELYASTNSGEKSQMYWATWVKVL